MYLGGKAESLATNDAEWKKREITKGFQFWCNTPNVAKNNVFLIQQTFKPLQSGG